MHPQHHTTTDYYSMDRRTRFLDYFQIYLPLYCTTWQLLLLQFLLKFACITYSGSRQIDFKCVCWEGPDLMLVGSLSWLVTKGLLGSTKQKGRAKQIPFPSHPYQHRWITGTVVGHSETENDHKLPVGYGRWCWLLGSCEDPGICRVFPKFIS